MKLVIVESPTKTKSLSKYLGKDFEVLATMGHIRDLPKSEMGVAIKSKGKDFEFEPTYVQSEGKADAIRKLKTAAKKAAQIILASDPDREGEAIAWHTKELLTEGKQGVKADKIDRITFHSITKEAVEEAIKNPRKIDARLVDAQQARRVLDRIVGYELSPVLWKKVRRGLSAGRVQSVAVRLIVEREKEIEAFKAEEYWEIKVEVADEKKNKFWVNLVKIGEKAAKITNGKQAEEIKTDLEKAYYVVEKVEKKERKLYPNPPFKTSTLQQAAANVLGWSAKKTMVVAQRLYEEGVITYHRTDSLNLVASAIDKVREVIVEKFGKEYLPDQAVFYKVKGKVVAQEAHEAVRPTDFALSELKEEDKDKNKLYQLIWRRTISCQMKPAVVDQTNVWVKADKYSLKAVGEIMKFASWKKLYKELEAVELPALSDGDKLAKEEVKTEQKFTLPPARFNDASLVKELEKRGIGRPSTYAPTISTIIVRGYVERKQRRFFATPVGIAVVEFLMKTFPTEMDYDFTAKMEESLDDIAGGDKDWQEVLSKFYGPFEETVKKAADAERVKVPVEKTGKKCPDCSEGEIVIRSGRFGKFLSCSRFPECKYTGKLIEYLEGAKCEKCGGRLVVKKTRKGREFYGCENYPKCDFATWNKPKTSEDGSEESKESQSQG